MAERWILHPDDDAPDALYGGKAGALRALMVAELPVPAWFVVAPAAFTDSGGEAAADDPAAFAALLPAEPIRVAIVAAARALCEKRGADGQVAVRSSAVDEDGADHSFAGQLDSFLAVRPDEVPARVAAVWRSGFSERILAYRRERKLGPPRPPAVLVQLMVVARAAGVAFSADPVSGRWNVAVVSAVPGLGTALVGGEADADTWRVDRSGTITERTIARKHSAHRAAPDSAEGVADEALAPEAMEAAAISDAEAIAVATLARRCARLRRRPQDIEWAFDGARLHLLQSRPITALGRVADPDGAPSLWDNSNIAESYGGITTPMTYSFARRAYEEVYRQFCRILGVSDSTIRENDETFRRMIGIVRGRVYYDLLAWYRVLALLPGFTANRAFMEQMMGVKEGLPPELAAQFAGASTGARVHDAFRLARTVFGLAINHLTMRRQIRAFRVRLNAALSEPTEALSEQRPDELAASYRELERRLLTRWDAPLVNDFLAMIFYGVLRTRCVAWCGDADGTLQNDLIGGEGGVISTEPAVRVRAMAVVAAADPAFAELLRSARLPTILSAMRSRRAFRILYESYLVTFGDRCLEELKLESATLEDDPLSLLRAVGHFASRTGGEAKDFAATARAAAEKRADAALAGHPLRRLVFGWVLRNARARVRDRENLRFERTRLFGRVRRIVLELGARLHAAGELDHERDVFWLELEELLGFFSGTATCPDLRALAAVRREAYRRFGAESAPADRFRASGSVNLGEQFRANAAIADAGGDQRRGTGCCPGIARGLARVVRDPRGVELPNGCILVAERTDPGWIMLFPAAAGLVVERGSLLSHSAIVSRELGIPAVVAVPGATAWLKDGDLVELDGATGVVRRITEAGA